MSSDRPAKVPRKRMVPTPAAVIVVCAVALTILGLTILFSASASFKQGPYYYLDKQLSGVAAAAVLCFVTSRVNLDYARNYAWWIAGAMLLLLALVVVPHVGIMVKGSRRWLGHGAVRLQVSEFAKLGMVFCLAHYLAINQTRIGEFKRGFLFPLLLIGAFAALILKEPDFGTAALTVAVGLLLLFLAGARGPVRGPLGGCGRGHFRGCRSCSTRTVCRGSRPSSTSRGTSSTGPTSSTSPWPHLRSAARAAPGWVEGRQQLNFLPEAHTDFILAVVGEELGLWFTLGVVALFVVIFCRRASEHLRRAPNLFHFLLAAGCILLICLQALINLGVVTGVFPTKGMSLPFISSGPVQSPVDGGAGGRDREHRTEWGRVSLPPRPRIPGGGAAA